MPAMSKKLYAKTCWKMASAIHEAALEEIEEAALAKAENRVDFLFCCSMIFFFFFLSN